MVWNWNYEKVNTIVFKYNRFNQSWYHFLPKEDKKMKRKFILTKNEDMFFFYAIICYIIDSIKHIFTAYLSV